MNYPIKRLYIIGSAVIFIIGMFISRSTHNEQETLKKSFNKKSILFNNRLILLTSNYWSLCRHPYYLGTFNKYIKIKWIFSIVFRKFSHVTLLGITV